MLWLKIPLLVTTNLAGNIPDRHKLGSPQKHLLCLDRKCSDFQFQLYPTQLETVPNSPSNYLAVLCLQMFYRCGPSLKISSSFWLNEAETQFKTSVARSTASLPVAPAPPPHLLMWTSANIHVTWTDMSCFVQISISCTAYDTYLIGYLDTRT